MTRHESDNLEAANWQHQTENVASAIGADAFFIGRGPESDALGPLRCARDALGRSAAPRRARPPCVSADSPPLPDSRDESSSAPAPTSGTPPPLICSSLPPDSALRHTVGMTGAPIFYVHPLEILVLQAQIGPQPLVAQPPLPWLEVGASHSRPSHCTSSSSCRTSPRRALVKREIAKNRLLSIVEIQGAFKVYLRLVQGILKILLSLVLTPERRKGKSNYNNSPRLQSHNDVRPEGWAVKQRNQYVNIEAGINYHRNLVKFRPSHRKAVSQRH